MTRIAYVATIQVLIDAESPSQARTALSTLLNKVQDTDPFILDWAYAQIGGQFLYPTERQIRDVDKYVDGEFTDPL